MAVIFPFTWRTRSGELNYLNFAISKRSVLFAQKPAFHVSLQFNKAKKT